MPLAKVATRVMVGATLAELREEGLLRPPTASKHTSVKEAVLPFNRFPGVDTVLGPEMRSTGEVMGIDRSFGLAFAKSQISGRQPAARARARSSCRSPTATRPPGSWPPGASSSSGSRIAATAGTAAHLEREPACRSTGVVAKVAEGTGRTRST